MWNHMQTIIIIQGEQNKIWKFVLKCGRIATFKAHFKRRATAVPNSIDRIKFDFSTAVARRLKQA